MEDIQIVDLYWQRSGLAIPETNLKYGIYCCHSGNRSNGELGFSGIIGKK